MATHDWMKGEYATAVREGRTERRERRGQQRTPLEIVLATAGFGAWVWCAYEILLGLLN